MFVFYLDIVGIIGNVRAELWCQCYRHKSGALTRDDIAENEERQWRSLPVSVSRCRKEIVVHARTCGDDDDDDEQVNKEMTFAFVTFMCKFTHQ